ncbi:hypothetical protein EXJ73_22090 [Pelomonas aquatica]|uniref:DUF5666 domain-containing protein n=2 Tax=Pelomonas aquatica TaxID=431058 RepID=A0A9X4R6T1_9BURK|nr:hypothetical protein [Pelomonas aquatica]
MPMAKSSYAVGRISGFGSIVINGVHYQEGKASVVDEDGEARSAADLKLGMVVEVKADEIGETNSVKSATAQNIMLASLIRGPVESVGTDGLVVLGQTVKVTNTTVFDEQLTGGLAAIKAGNVVRVYGTFEASTGIYTASRIDLQDNPQFYRLRGAVAAYDATAKTLRVGNATIDVSGVTVPDGLKVGSLVRVKLQTTQVKGAWVAVGLKLGLFEPQNNDHTEVEGVITDFTSSSVFSVNGLPVDASKAAFPDGTAAIVKGARVEVEGAIVNGTLVATKVKIETDDQDEHNGFDVEGVISAVDAAKSTFVVRGVTVSYAGNVNFVGGAAADLKKDVKVEVHGTLSADHTVLTATRIEFKH